jgi:hypothetical protein
MRIGSTVPRRPEAAYNLASSGLQLTHVVVRPCFGLDDEA